MTALGILNIILRLAGLVVMIVAIVFAVRTHLIYSKLSEEQKQKEYAWLPITDVKLLFMFCVGLLILSDGPDILNGFINSIK